MAGIEQLSELLKGLSPRAQEGEFAFCTVDKGYACYAHLEPLASFQEAEGLTLILPVVKAQAESLTFDTRFKQITLSVRSSLDAVGLTAIVAAKLAEINISANVVAAYYHDHIFVPSERAEEALVALQAISN